MGCQPVQRACTSSRAGAACLHLLKPGPALGPIPISRSSPDLCSCMCLFATMFVGVCVTGVEVLLEPSSLHHKMGSSWRSLRPWKLHLALLVGSWKSGCATAFTALMLSVSDQSSSDEDVELPPASAESCLSSAVGSSSPGLAPFPGRQQSLQMLSYASAGGHVGPISSQSR